MREHLWCPWIFWLFTEATWKFRIFLHTSYPKPCTFRCVHPLHWQVTRQRKMSPQWKIVPTAVEYRVCFYLINAYVDWSERVRKENAKRRKHWERNAGILANSLRRRFLYIWNLCLASTCSGITLVLMLTTFIKCWICSMNCNWDIRARASAYVERIGFNESSIDSRLEPKDSWHSTAHCRLFSIQFPCCSRSRRAFTLYICLFCPCIFSQMNYASFLVLVQGIHIRLWFGFDCAMVSCFVCCVSNRGFCLLKCSLYRFLGCYGCVTSMVVRYGGAFRWLWLWLTLLLYFGRCAALMVKIMCREFACSTYITRT